MLRSFLASGCWFMYQYSLRAGLAINLPKLKGNLRYCPEYVAWAL